MLSGKRTYIIAGLMAVTSGLYGMGIIDTTVYGTIMGILNGSGFMALRSGVTTESKAAADEVKASVVITPQPGRHSV